MGGHSPTRNKWHGQFESLLDDLELSVLLTPIVYWPEKRCVCNVIKDKRTRSISLSLNKLIRCQFLDLALGLITLS